MDFLPRTKNCLKVLGLALDSKRRYLAVCELVDEALGKSNGVDNGKATGNDRRAQVSVYDLKATPAIKKIRTLTHELEDRVSSREFISATFSGDGKQLACQTSAPDFTVVVWDWFRSRRVGSCAIKSRIRSVLQSILPSHAARAHTHTSNPISIFMDARTLQSSMF